MLKCSVLHFYYAYSFSDNVKKQTTYIYIYVYIGFPGDSDGKESTCDAGDLGLIPGLEDSPREGNGYPLQNFGLENSMERGTTVHGVTKGFKLILIKKKKINLNFAFFISSVLSFLS